MQIDGVRLSDEQIDWYMLVRALIKAPDPTRPAISIDDQARRAFRMAHKMVGRRWVKRTVIQLGDSPGDAVIHVK